MCYYTSIWNMIFKLRILLKYRNIELPRDHPWYTLGLFKFLDTQLPHVGILTTQGIFTRVPPIFLIKLDIKPLMHLLEISIFSPNNDLVRLTKIMNNRFKDLEILSFKVIFQCLKLVESFQKKFCEEYLIRRPTFINEIFWKLWFLKYFIY